MLVHKQNKQKQNSLQSSEDLISLLFFSTLSTFGECTFKKSYYSNTCIANYSYATSKSNPYINIVVDILQRNRDE